MSKQDDVLDFEERYQWLREVTDDAIVKRTKNAEFHGIEQELRELQISMLDEYQRSVQLNHPRDKGDFREQILRNLLLKSGLIPQRYTVAQRRVRVVAPSGHVSPELDIVFYNTNDTIVLRRLEGVVDYLPLESVHGTVQVKSKLTKKAIIDGLDNIKQFKSLVPKHGLEQKVGELKISTGLYRRFGILFAYEYGLEWTKVCEELRKFTENNPPEVWPNLVFILNKGYFRLGDDKSYAWKNRDQLKIKTAIVHGAHDLTGSCFLDFYLYLLALLEDTPAGPARIHDYIRMPIVARDMSYSFTHGATDELLRCTNSQHGKYLKKLKYDSLKQIVEYVSDAKAENWIKAMDIALGRDISDEQKYERQPEFVYIYNPDKLPYSEILIFDDKSMAVTSINHDGKTIWIPIWYIAKDEMFEDCPKCLQARKRKSKRSKGTK